MNEDARRRCVSSDTPVLRIRPLILNGTRRLDVVIRFMGKESTSRKAGKRPIFISKKEASDCDVELPKKTRQSHPRRFLRAYSRVRKRKHECQALEPASTGGTNAASSFKATAFWVYFRCPWSIRRPSFRLLEQQLGACSIPKAAIPLTAHECQSARLPLTGRRFSTFASLSVNAQTG